MGGSTVFDLVAMHVHAIVTDVRPKLKDLQLLKDHDGHEIRIIERVASKWIVLAVALNFDESRIEIIEEDKGRSVEKACLEMFIRWLNGEHDQKMSTWGTLIQCLTQAGLDDVARTLKKILAKQL